MDKKIKMLVIPSDRTGVGKFRSVDPHVYIGEHYSDDPPDLRDLHDQRVLPVRRRDQEAL